MQYNQSLFCTNDKETTTYETSINTSTVLKPPLVHDTYSVVSDVEGIIKEKDAVNIDRNSSVDKTNVIHDIQFTPEATETSQNVLICSPETS